MVDSRFPMGAELRWCVARLAGWMAGWKEYSPAKKMSVDEHRIDLLCDL